MGMESCPNMQIYEINQRKHSVDMVNDQKYDSFI